MSFVTRRRLIGEAEVQLYEEDFDWSLWWGVPIGRSVT